MRYLFAFAIVTALLSAAGWKQGAPCRAEDSQFDVLLYINDNYLMAGDAFRLTVRERNNYTSANIVYRRYIILDVYGTYYFWPSWQAREDFLELYLRARETSLDTILQFTWPSGTGSAQNIRFWAGAVLRDNPSEALGYDYKDFSYFEPATPTPDPQRSPTPTPVYTPTAAPTPDHFEYSFTVPGNASALPTGIYLNPSDWVSISAWGEVCFHAGICSQTTVGPDGYAETCHDQECNDQPYTPTRHHAALIGRLGPSGAYFLVGSKLLFRPDQAGELILGINDGGLTDNEGSFSGVVFVYPD